MKILLICLAITLSGFFSPAIVSAEEHPGKAEVMLFGLFHFANPGHDQVKVDQTNVMTEENQAYIVALASRLAGFKPTHMLAECNPAHQDRVQKNYDQYLKGEYVLTANENDQLGFRVAKLSGLPTVICYDEKEVGWDPELLFSYMPDHDPETQKMVDVMIEEISAEQSRSHQTLSMKELLLQSNDPEQDRINKSYYLITNHVGAGENFAGADATASWWHRNFRMYANIQKAAQPGTRVLVLGGQGHTAILRDFLDVDQHRRSVDVRPYIQ